LLSAILGKIIIPSVRNMIFIAKELLKK